VSKLTEDEARQMEAGEELDRICAEWMDEVASCPKDDFHPFPGELDPFDYHGVEVDPYDEGDDRDMMIYCYRYSKDWGPAGPLLEVMSGHIMRTDCGWECWIDERNNAACARSPQLAIARACAALVARGVTREEVEGE